MARWSDDRVVERLTEVRGVGRWTVEMLLIFELGRPDVLPLDDLGVHKGFSRVFGGELPAKDRAGLARRALASLSQRRQLVPLAGL